MHERVKHVSPGVGEYGRLYVTIRVTTEPVNTERHFGGKTRLSITGVEGPRSNGDARGSCGQCVEALDHITTLSPGWTPEMVRRLKAEWERWHLNDLRAGCEHQRKGLDLSKKVEVVSYKLTSEAHRLRERTLAVLAKAALAGEKFELTPRERALAGMTKWFKPRFQPPDADSPLSGCYEVERGETKSIGWVYPHEHPEGVLGLACDVCGYKYGAAWLYEPVPEDVLEFLASLPEDASLPRCWQD
jgi:hypothetical protein